MKIAPTQGRKERCNVVKIILSGVLVLIALVLIMVVMLQSGKSAGLSGTIAGVADTFMSKNKAKGWDAKLARWTKWVAIAFMVLLLVISLI
ncbi:MAG: preprotein translocase subunit SecG [Clostridiales bacterium]|nr:preprotein translocase subunit SecG [Clostridiales bacterium]